MPSFRQNVTAGFEQRTVDAVRYLQRGGEQVLFLLDAQNSLERDLLKQWINEHCPNVSEEFQAPQVILDLSEDRKGIDSSQLVMALALPPWHLIRMSAKNKKSMFLRCSHHWVNLSF